jgi:hypothetical protein
MRAVRVVALAVAVSALTLGCGNDDGGSPPAAGGASTTSPAPEDITTSSAAVAAGLRQVTTLAGQIAAAGTAKDAATSLADQLEPIWQTIEGTVKANDQNAYLAFEDNFALLATGAQAGDAAKTQQGAAGVVKASADYLARYPG